MKLDIFSRPLIDFKTIADNLSPTLVSELDSTNRGILNVMDVLSSKFFALSQHVHFSFYFQIPTDMLMEILCYTPLSVTRDVFDDYTDEGILSGSLATFIDTLILFCQPPVSKDLRLFFNTMCRKLEQEGVPIHCKKVDFGDGTFVLTRGSNV